MIPVRQTQLTREERRTRKLQRMLEQHERLERRLVRAQSLWQASRVAIRRMEVRLDKDAADRWGVDTGNKGE